MNANKYSCFLSLHYDTLIETCKGHANVYLKVNIGQNEIYTKYPIFPISFSSFQQFFICHQTSYFDYSFILM